MTTISDQHKARLAEFKKLMSQKDTIKITKILFDGETHSLTSVVDSSKIESFLTASYIAYIEAEIQRLEGEKEELPKGKCMNLENHLFSSCFQCEKIKGHNSCLDKQITYLQEQLKEIK